MEEKIIKKSEAEYFKSATNLIKGYLVMTNKRLLYYGEQARMQFNHGVIENVNHELRRFGFSKRLVISDGNGNEYKLTIFNKADRNSWSGEIDRVKSGN